MRRLWTGHVTGRTDQTDAGVAAIGASTTPADWPGDSELLVRRVSRIGWFMWAYHADLTYPYR